jgi:hypothetical protein
MAATLSGPDLIRRRRLRLGRCVKCGYDRHSLAADVKCPECGALPDVSVM